MALLLHKTALVNFPMATTVTNFDRELLAVLVIGFFYFHEVQILCGLTGKVEKTLKILCSLIHYGWYIFLQSIVLSILT